MKYIIAIALIVLCNGYVTGQTDTIKVEITALQAQKIAEINKAKSDLKKQYEDAVKQLDGQLSDHLIFIADANKIDPKTIKSVPAIEPKSITYIVHITPMTAKKR